MNIEQSNITEPVNEQVAMSANSSVYLSKKETKKILTPFAFEIDKSLFGLPLAVPRKRAIALLIDFIFISLLAETPGELLALVAAFTFYRLGSKNPSAPLKDKRSIRKGMLRGLGAMIFLITILSYITPYINQFFDDNERPITQNTPNKNIEVINNFALSAMTFGMTTEISQSQCTSELCLSKLISPLLDGYFELGISAEKMTIILSEAIENSNLSTQAQVSLITSLTDEFLVLTKNKVENSVSKPKKTEAISTVNKKPNKQVLEEKSVFYDGVDWINGKIENLGLSFGWAALYFSVLTSIGKGQTLGKRIMKIRVIQLDGTPLSVWDSFGRYGGYGAGLATGLMGFMQIYWDANRQCIHDKISSTVVIDLKKINKQK